MLRQTMESILSSSTSNHGFPSPSLLNTKELLEMLMLPDSRGLTRKTDHLWPLLRTNTWPSSFIGLAVALLPCSTPTFPMEPGELSLFVYATFKEIKTPFFFPFLLQRKFYILYLTAIYSFPTPKRHGAWSFSSL